MPFEIDSIDAFSVPERRDVGIIESDVELGGPGRLESHFLIPARNGAKQHMNGGTIEP